MNREISGTRINNEMLYVIYNTIAVHVNQCLEFTVMIPWRTILHLGRTARVLAIPSSPHCRDFYHIKPQELEILSINQYLMIISESIKTTTKDYYDSTF